MKTRPVLSLHEYTGIERLITLQLKHNDTPAPNGVYAFQLSTTDCMLKPHTIYPSLETLLAQVDDLRFCSATPWHYSGVSAAAAVARRAILAGCDAHVVHNGQLPPMRMRKLFAPRRQ
jgi:hypothetical protein